MTLVVDTSVAVKFVVQEEGSAEAKHLAASSERLAAPDLIHAELANVFWRMTRAGKMRAEQQDAALSEIAMLLDEVFPLAPLAPLAMHMSRTLDHPAYDCFYLALAYRSSARLLTADQRLVRRLAGTEWAGLPLSLT